MRSIFVVRILAICFFLIAGAHAQNLETPESNQPIQTREQLLKWWGTHQKKTGFKDIKGFGTFGIDWDRACNKFKMETKSKERLPTYQEIVQIYQNYPEFSMMFDFFKLFRNQASPADLERFSTPENILEWYRQVKDIPVMRSLPSVNYRRADWNKAIIAMGDGPFYNQLQKVFQNSGRSAKDELREISQTTWISDLEKFPTISSLLQWWDQVRFHPAFKDVTSFGYKGLHWDQACKKYLTIEPTDEFDRWLWKKTIEKYGEGPDITLIYRVYGRSSKNQKHRSPAEDFFGKHRRSVERKNLLDFLDEKMELVRNHIPTSGSTLNGKPVSIEEILQVIEKEKKYVIQPDATEKTIGEMLGYSNLEQTNAFVRDNQSDPAKYPVWKKLHQTLGMDKFNPSANPDPRMLRFYQRGSFVHENGSVELLQRFYLQTYHDFKDYLNQGNHLEKFNQVFRLAVSPEVMVFGRENLSRKIEIAQTRYQHILAQARRDAEAGNVLVRAPQEIDHVQFFLDVTHGYENILILVPQEKKINLLKKLKTEGEPQRFNVLSYQEWARMMLSGQVKVQEIQKNIQFVILAQFNQVKNNLEIESAKKFVVPVLVYVNNAINNNNFDFYGKTHLLEITTEMAEKAGLISLSSQRNNQSSMTQFEAYLERFSTIEKVLQWWESVRHLPEFRDLKGFGNYSTGNVWNKAIDAHGDGPRYARIRNVYWKVPGKSPWMDFFGIDKSQVMKRKPTLQKVKIASRFSTVEEILTWWESVRGYPAFQGVTGFNQKGRVWNDLAQRFDGPTHSRILQTYKNTDRSASKDLFGKARIRSSQAYLEKFSTPDQILDWWNSVRHKQPFRQLTSFIQNGVNVYDLAVKQHGDGPSYFTISRIYSKHSGRTMSYDFFGKTRWSRNSIDGSAYSSMLPLPKSWRPIITGQNISGEPLINGNKVVENVQRLGKNLVASHPNVSRYTAEFGKFYSAKVVADLVLASTNPEIGVAKMLEMIRASGVKGVVQEAGAYGVFATGATGSGIVFDALVKKINLVHGPKLTQLLVNRGVPMSSAQLTVKRNIAFYAGTLLLSLASHPNQPVKDHLIQSMYGWMGFMGVDTALRTGVRGTVTLIEQSRKTKQAEQVIRLAQKIKQGVALDTGIYGWMVLMLDMAIAQPVTDWMMTTIQTGQVYNDLLTSQLRMGKGHVDTKNFFQSLQRVQELPYHDVFQTYTQAQEKQDELDQEEQLRTLTDVQGNPVAYVGPISQEYAQQSRKIFIDYYTKATHQFLKVRQQPSNMNITHAVESFEKAYGRFKENCIENVQAECPKIEQDLTKLQLDLRKLRSVQVNLNPPSPDRSMVQQYLLDTYLNFNSMKPTSEDHAWTLAIAQKLTWEALKQEVQNAYDPREALESQRRYMQGGDYAVKSPRGLLFVLDQATPKKIDMEWIKLAFIHKCTQLKDQGYIQTAQVLGQEHEKLWENIYTKISRSRTELRYNPEMDVSEQDPIFAFYQPQPMARIGSIPVVNLIQQSPLESTRSIYESYIQCH